MRLQRPAQTSAGTQYTHETFGDDRTTGQICSDKEFGRVIDAKLRARCFFYTLTLKLFHKMEEKFDMWALVELMGHNKIAGRVTEHKFGNQSMLRIDVPAVGDIQSFTKIVAVGSIYAINPLTEQSATDYAAHLKASPFEVWDMNAILESRINSLLKVGKLLQPEIPVIDQGENDDPF